MQHPLTELNANTSTAEDYYDLELVLLMRQNRTGQLAQRVAGGFVRAVPRHPTPIVYAGLTNQIKLRFRAPTGKARYIQDPQTRHNHTRVHGSNRGLGSRVHAYIYHLSVCMARGTCLCNSKSSMMVVPANEVHMVNTALEALSREHLVPLCGEQVITPPLSDTARIATSLDLLAEYMAPPTEPVGQLVLISVKTTGRCPFSDDCRYAAFDPIMLEPPKKHHIACVTLDEALRRQHLAQLACELYMLRAGHNVKRLRAACILYLFPHAPVGTYRIVYLANESFAPMACARVWRNVVA